MSFWRAAGLTYINYSSIAAKVTRQALKTGPLKVSSGITSIAIYDMYFVFEPLFSVLCL